MSITNIKGEAELNREASDRQIQSRRKSSLSDALSKMVSTTFSRRWTSLNLPTEDETATRAAHHTLERSSSRIPRRNSFFGTLTSESSISKKENDEPQSALPKRSHRISDRLSQTPFFSTQTRDSAVPSLAPRNTRRESKTHVAERKLMAPIAPPLPRSSTMPIQPLSSPSVPSFMRPTSSSTARRSDVVLIRSSTTIQDGPGIPTPRKTQNSRASIGHPGGAQRRTSASRLMIASTAVESQSGPFMAPLREQSLTPSTTKLDKAPVSKSCQLGEAIRESTPVAEGHLESNGEHTEIATPLGASNPRLVNTAQPDGYWAGRVSALSDRFRTEALATASFSTPLAPSTIDAYEETRANRMHDDDRRIRRVFVHLKSLCTTEEAKDSLEAFKKAYEARMARGDTVDKEVKKAEKDKDKKGVWEKITGRKRVRSMA